MPNQELVQTLVHPCKDCRKYKWCDYPCDKFEAWHEEFKRMQQNDEKRQSEQVIQ